MIFSKHIKKIGIPRTEGQVDLTQHNNLVTTESLLRQAPRPVFIPNAKSLTAEFISKCPRCNASKLKPFKAPLIHYSALVKQNAISLFSSISGDIISLEFAGNRSNHMKTYYILVCFCCLSECVEFFLCEDMKESTIITKLLVLQTRFNAIRLIITDQGTNLKNLNREGNVTFSDEPMQIFALLKQAVNASAHNQRANWCEAAIKKKLKPHSKH